jgi:glycogen operon protein
MHARGYTIGHPSVSEPGRGTFAGLAAAEVIDYVRGLGVTSVELLPVHAYLDDQHLLTAAAKPRACPNRRLIKWCLS